MTSDPVLAYVRAGLDRLSHTGDGGNLVEERFDGGLWIKIVPRRPGAALLGLNYDRILVDGNDTVFITGSVMDVDAPAGQVHLMFESQPLDPGTVAAEWDLIERILTAAASGYTEQHTWVADELCRIEAMLVIDGEPQEFVAMQFMEVRDPVTRREHVFQPW